MVRDFYVNDLEKLLTGIGTYLKFYNQERKDQTLGMTPDQMNFEETIWHEAA